MKGSFFDIGTEGFVYLHVLSLRWLNIYPFLANYNLAQIAQIRFLVYVVETFKTKKKNMEMLSIPLFALLYSLNSYNVTLRCNKCHVQRG